MELAELSSSQRSESSAVNERYREGIMNLQVLISRA